MLGLNINVKKSIKYVLVLLCIFITDAVSLPLDDELKVYLIVPTGCFLFGIHLIKSNFNISKEEILWMYLAILFILITQVTNMDASLSYEYKIAQLFIALFIVANIPENDFLQIFTKILLVIAFISLLVWLSIVIGSSWYTILPTTQGGKYYSLGICVIHTNTIHGVIPRNYGPFWEPGVYQAYLNVALLCCLFCGKAISWKNVVIIVISIITTFSTTGYFCLALIVLAFIVNKMTTINVRNIIIISVVCVVIAFIIVNPEINHLVFGKFSQSSASNISFAIRLKDLECYFLAWLKDPIIGIGMTESYNYAMSVFREGDFFNFTGSTNTTLREMAGLGLYFGITRIISQYKYSKMWGKKTSGHLLVFLMFMIILNTESLIYSLMFNTLFYYSVIKK